MHPRQHRSISSILCAAMLFVAAPTVALAQNVCPRFDVGSTVTDPPTLFSSHGVLQVSFAYETTVDAAGRTLFCFMMANGQQSPTLHVWPGDHLLLTLKNHVPPAAPFLPTMHMAPPSIEVSAAKAPAVALMCGSLTMTDSSVNVHYHGTNVSPTCHSDEVIHTLINSGDTFTYDIAFPNDEPPGLYWYHPHVHGISEGAVQGGASGAIIVEGLQNVQPAVAGLPQRVLVIRDNNVAGNPTAGGAVPSWDVSLNYIPIAYPALTPSVIALNPGETQLWRVLNACADTIIDLQLQYDGQPQVLKVVGLDGVPTGSQDGTRRGQIIEKTHILLAPAARAEFLVTGPALGVRTAGLVTLGVDTGPLGDNDPTRTLAAIDVRTKAPVPVSTVPAVSGPVTVQRFEGLVLHPPTDQRTLYFSEVVSDPANPLSPTNFYITVDGATPVLFNADNPPALVTHQGAVEDWTIENRSGENHEFHIHQLHFLLLRRNGVPVANADQQFLDMIQVPYWSGSGPYPSVTVRLDFRGADIGDFVYHCHILGHEDGGMMAIIRVLPAAALRKETPHEPR
jgi:FtsP/CotA-like multicopper oxidase with cupredoxin domain